MNSNWRNRPTTIDYISKDIDWIIGIDESGSPSLKQVQKSRKNGTEPIESERHFTVTAAAIKMEDFGAARDMVMALKNKYWSDAISLLQINKTEDLMKILRFIIELRCKYPASVPRPSHMCYP